MAIPFANQSPFNDLEPIKTGTLIDKLSGIGGIPRKRITEIFGDASVGKSTLCLQAVANAQALGIRAVWADVEWAYDARYAESLGVDNSTLGLIQKEAAEDVFNDIQQAVLNGECDLVIIDSIGGLIPRDVIAKSIGEKTIGGQAGLVAVFCRKIVPLLALHNVALVVINHSFTDIMTAAIKTSGGKKLEYHKSLSIRLKQKFGVTLEQGGRKIGKVIVGQVMKNKLAPTEGLEVDSRILFGEGFSKSADLMQDAIDAGVLEKRGNLYYFAGDKIGMISKVREAMKVDSFSEQVKAAMP